MPSDVIKARWMGMGGGRPVDREIREVMTEGGAGERSGEPAMMKKVIA